MEYFCSFTFVTSLPLKNKGGWKGIFLYIHLVTSLPSKNKGGWNGILFFCENKSAMVGR